MSLPQFGIFAQGTVAHYFQEFDLRPNVGIAQAVEAIGRLRQPAVSAGGVNLVMAFGAGLWRRIAPTETPASLAPFNEIGEHQGKHVPATQHDLWLWISGSTFDVVFEHVHQAANLLNDVAVLSLEQPCFAHRDSRDLTGFIDGTANPQLLDAPNVALIPADEVGGGGSYVLAMRWVHDLAAFEALPIEEQQRVFGRTKIDSVELEGEAKPPTAHISRVEITDPAGGELPIYRRSVPYGTVREHGLYFVAFSSDLGRYNTMLARMFGVSSDGLRDRLTDFSRPVSAGYYFAPSLTRITRLAEAGAQQGRPMAISDLSLTK